MLGVFFRQSDQPIRQLQRHGITRQVLAHLIHQVAENILAVGITHRLVHTHPTGESGQLTVVGEDPVTAPQLTHKRMGVGQVDRTHIGLTDVRDRSFALDRIVLQKARNAGLTARLDIVEGTYALAFVKRHAPAVLVRPGCTATLDQARKTEA